MDPGVRAGPRAGCAPASPRAPLSAPHAPRGTGERRPGAGRGGRSAAGPPGPAPARAGGGVMSRQGGGAGAAGPAGRRGRYFPALKRQEAERGPASERDSETPNSPAQSPRQGGRPGAGTRARVHISEPRPPPPCGAPGAATRLCHARTHPPPHFSGARGLSRARAGARRQGERGPFAGDPTPGGSAKRPLLPLLLLLAAAAAWMPSTSFPVPSKFPLGPPVAVCGSGETLGPSAPAGGTMKSAEEGKRAQRQSPTAAPEAWGRPRTRSPAPIRSAPGPPAPCGVPARGGASRPV